MPTFVSRSIESIVLHSVTAGIANRIMNDAISTDHTNSGTRLSDMPGARSLKTVAMTLTAPDMLPISTSVTICDQASTRLPGEYSGPDSGV